MYLLYTSISFALVLILNPEGGILDFSLQYQEMFKDLKTVFVSAIRNSFKWHSLVLDFSFLTILIPLSKDCVL